MSRRTYYRDNECNPHKKIESTKNVVEDFLVILGWRRGDDVPVEPREALDGFRLKALSR
jgi:hypothetical protein